MDADLAIAMDHSQANKPKWPATDCYHGCCDGAAPAAKATPAVKEAKADADKMAKAEEAIAEAKEAKKEAVKELEKAADSLVSTSLLT